jgi:multidrug efflux pump subunit AcrA (membrane-fusion protein)
MTRTLKIAVLTLLVVVGIAFMKLGSFGQSSPQAEDSPSMSMNGTGPERIQKLGVRTEQVERRDPAQTVRAVGTIQIDETRQTVIAPRFEGWIEKLYVDATGMKVKKGALCLFSLVLT